MDACHVCSELTRQSAYVHTSQTWEDLMALEVTVRLNGALLAVVTSQTSLS
jgi:recombinational DNA repair protein RecR